MFFILGIITVFGCVLGGYTAMGGSLRVLNQPFEVLIICGAALGAFFIANGGALSKKVAKNIKVMFKGKPYNKADYLELMCFLYVMFKQIKMKGMLAIEKDIENPNESATFQKFPSFSRNPHHVDFFCDYMRVHSMGVDNHYQMDDIMTQELDIHHHESLKVASAITSMGDGIPALGIVAAVLGIIKTMGHIDEPPEILGKMIGGALVGTFLGVFVAYGFVSPMGSYMAKFFESEAKYLECIKAGIIAHMQGNAPAISVEFTRKMIPHDLRPSFQEVEEAIENVRS